MYKITLSPTFASNASLNRTIAEQAKLDLFGNKFRSVVEAEEHAIWITGIELMFTSRIERIN